MLYEAHISIGKYPDRELAKRFHADITAAGFKKTNFLALSHGEFPLQLMLVDHKELFDDRVAMAWGVELSSKMLLMGYDVSRIKVESRLSPGKARYYEAHWKLNLQNTKQGDLLKEFLQLNPGWLYSWNVLREGLHYLSTRVYTSSAPGYEEYVSKVANEQFIHREQQIKDFGLPLEGGHYERVLFDTNHELDRGWDPLI